MAFLCRIKQSKLKCWSHQFKRYYPQIPYSVNYTTSHTMFSVEEKPVWVIPKKPTEFCNNLRFFAAPVQAKPKQEVKEPTGPRRNDQIKANFVRLVLDEGHVIVSRNEALDRARKLNLDLVEVDRKADPPVCKIIDFHREKYKQQLKEKDRAKSKSALTLRKGDCKEVRFSGKTEQKDLQMKADTVKRLMDRGYRVKCMAMGTEDQDLGGLLSRLSALIEDVSIVESGPRVEKKQAYVIVRHIKFGPSKKGTGKIASKAVGVTSTEAQKAPTMPPTAKPSSPIQSPVQFEVDLNSAESGLETDEGILSDEADTSIFPSMGMPNKNLEENKTTWSVSNASDDLDEIFDLSDDAKGFALRSTGKEMNTAPEIASFPASTYTPEFLPPKPVLDSTRANTAQSSPPELPLSTENRYRRNEPRNRILPVKAMENMGTGARDSAGLQPQFPNQGRKLRSDLDVSPSTRETKQVGTDATVFRNLKLPLNDIPKQEQFRPGSPSSARPSYGAFSSVKTNVPGQQGISSEVERNKEVISFNSTYPVRLESQLPSQEQFRPGSPSSARPSYGAFSSAKTNVPGQHGVSSEVKRNKEVNSFNSTDPVKLESQLPSQELQQIYDLDVSRSTKQVGTDGSIFRSLKRPPNYAPKPEQSRLGPPSSAAPGYGIFSATKANAPGKQGFHERKPS